MRRRVPKLKDLDLQVLNLRLAESRSVFSRVSLNEFLNELKEELIISKTTKYTHFVEHLVSEGILERIKIETPNLKTERFVAQKLNIHPFEIALSINPGSYLSHYSALFVHELTHNIPKDIYINREQTPKPKNTSNALTQKKIDYAFSRPMRTTNQIAIFTYRKTKYKVYMLNGKNTKNLGVIQLKNPHTYNPIPITNLERTIIDSVVRPKYAGGIEELANAFARAKERLSVNRLLGILKKLDFVYPYEKSILFYLMYCYYSESQINQVLRKIEKNENAKFNFYLDYQIPFPTLHEKSGVYVPQRVIDTLIY